jgi:hypothetical protein
MTRHGNRANSRTASKKALRNSGRKVKFRRHAHVSMLRRRRMSRASNSAGFVDDIFGQDRVWTSYGAVGLGSRNMVVDVGDVHGSEYGPESAESVTGVDGAQVQRVT